MGPHQVFGKVAWSKLTITLHVMLDWRISTQHKNIRGNLSWKAWSFVQLRKQIELVQPKNYLLLLSPSLSSFTSFLSLPHTHTYSLSFLHTHSQSPLSLSLAYTHVHTLSHSLSPLTHTHSLTLRSLSLILVHSLFLFELETSSLFSLSLFPVIQITWLRLICSYQLTNSAWSSTNAPQALLFFLA